MNETINERVARLRQWMENYDLQAYIIPSTDPHASEYTPGHWECRKWISGFTGSAGTAVVTPKGAALWTDSRYFIAAEEQLAGTPFTLMKERVEGTPTIAQWICEQVGEGSKVGIDGAVFTLEDAQNLERELMHNGIALVPDFSAPDELWTDRPPVPTDPIVIQPLEWAGETASSKIRRVMETVKAHGCSRLLVTALDEVAWLLNLRGRDVHCNPVFVSYALVGDEETLLFVNPEKITDEVGQYLQSNNVRVIEYEKCAHTIAGIHENILLSPQTNVALAQVCLDRQRGRAAVAPSPIAPMKAVKNECEIRGMDKAMEQDGVALVKWLRWLETAVPAGNETEMSIDKKLTKYRAEFADFRGLSFDTIAGYKEHGAIVHYEATTQTDAPLKAEGLLLVDSGAQYECGTTDITRTLLLGSKPTDEERRVYTLVLKGHIALSRTRFPEGSTGTQLDLAARYAMWQYGYNYGHGTGHGVGAHLLVHEGPHQIRMNYVAAPIKAGMTVTDEPGIYLEGRFGVRTENVLLCVPHTQSEFGTFVAFRPLTLCPIDLRPVDWSMLTQVEVDWINDYHKEVASRLLPLLEDEADRQWLIQACEEKKNNY